MRVTLEWSDVLRILSKHLGRDLDDTNVSVKADPFEIEVRGIEGMEDLRTATPPLSYPTGVRATERAVVSDVIVTDEPSRPRTADADVFTTLQQAREIERELSKLRR